MYRNKLGEIMCNKNEKKFKELKLELAKIEETINTNYQISKDYKALLLTRKKEILTTDNTSIGTLCRVKKNKGNGVLYVYLQSNRDIKENDICVIKKLKFI